MASGDLAHGSFPTQRDTGPFGRSFRAIPSPPMGRDRAGVEASMKGRGSPMQVRSAPQVSRRGRSREMAGAASTKAAERIARVRGLAGCDPTQVDREFAREAGNLF